MELASDLQRLQYIQLANLKIMQFSVYKHEIETCEPCSDTAFAWLIKYDSENITTGQCFEGRSKKYVKTTLLVLGEAKDGVSCVLSKLILLCFLFPQNVDGSGKLFVPHIVQLNPLMPQTQVRAFGEGKTAPNRRFWSDAWKSNLTL